MTLDATFQHAEGNINLSLLDSGGGLLGSSSTATDNESISYLTTAADTLLVRVELFADAGSLPGNTYELTLGLSAPTCASDTFEPNDDLGSAAVVTATDYPGLSACDSDDDWFRIALLNGESVDFDVAFSTAEGNIDIELFDGTSSLLADSTGAGPTEAVSFTAPGDMDVYLRVFLVSDAGTLPGNGYTLSVAGVAPTCVPDGFEPNDALIDAAVLPAGTTGNLSVCPSDEDWFGIEVAAGDTLTVDLSFDHGEGDLNLELFDPSGSSLGSSTSTSDDEQVGLVVAASGPVLVHVVLAADTGSVPGNTYSLNLDILAPTCPEDGLEPNDSTSSPAPITAGTYPDLSACSSDDDYYALSLLAGDVVNVDVLFAHAEGDIDLELVDAGGAPVADSASQDDDESLSYTVTADGDYMVRVVLTADAGDLGTPYTLLVGTAAAVCEPDVFEPNDDAGNAAAITADVFDQLTACDGDSDWYSLLLPVGTVLDIDVAFVDAEGDIDLYFYDDAQNLIDASDGFGDGESIAQVTGYSGEYLVEVVLASDAGALPGNGYTLSVSAPPPPCLTDAAEPNDAFDESASITPDGLDNLAACPTDSDWFLILPAPGDDITIDVLFAHAEGDIDVTLYDDTVTFLTSGVSVDDDETLSWTIVDQAPLLLEVTLVQDTGLAEGNPYSIEFTGLSEVCLPDILEGNDAPEFGTVALDGDSFSALSACPTDSDWFALDLAAGDSLVVQTTFVHAEGDVDVVLYDPSQGYLTAATSSDDDETLSYITNDTGTHYIEVVLAADAGSEPGNSYAIDFDVVSTICVEDAYEPDNNLQNATVVTAGLIEDLSACSGSDWFAIDVATAETLTATASFEHAEGDIDLRLYDDGGAELLSSESADDDEQVIFNSTATGTYYVEVELFADLGGDAGNAYSLDLAVVAINCTADAFEPNDAQGSPVSLPPGATAGLVACPTDSDWFNFSASAGEVIDVLAQFDAADGDLDLELFDPSGTSVATATSSTSNEQILHTAAMSGDYVLGVSFVSEGAPPDGVDYTLNLAVSSEACLFDWAEDNDDFNGPTPLNLGTHPHLVVCETDEDWFTVEVADGQILDLSALFSHAEGDIDLTLYDSTLTFVGQASSTDDDENLTYAPPPSSGGTHFVQVTLVADTGSITGNPYTLSVAYVDQSGCPVDAYEDNEGPTSLSIVGLGTYANLSVCETDEDWYGMPVTAGDVLDIDLTFAHADGDIDVVLYDISMAVVGGSDSVTDNESVSYTAPADGALMIQVLMPADDVAGGGNTYDMAISGTASGCGNDVFEQDDSLGDAAPLPLGTTGALNACPSDDDWSLVLLDAGQTATWTASFAHAEGDIDLQVYDSAGNLLDSAVSVTDNETVSWTATSFGYYYLLTTLVSDAGGPGNGYSLGLSIN